MSCLAFPSKSDEVFAIRRYGLSLLCSVVLEFKGGGDLAKMDRISCFYFGAVLGSAPCARDGGC